MTRIRLAEMSDLDAIADLLLDDAKQRAAKEPELFALNADPRGTARESVGAALRSEGTPIRQRWFVAEDAGKIVGVAHSILLPVPPIYAGEFGPPGLIMEDCHLSQSASEDIRESLLSAVEDDLITAGAKILLLSSVPGGPWEAVCAAAGYRPLTLYYTKSNSKTDRNSADVRPATVEDVEGIVTLSETNREVLHALDPFWKPHPEARARFDGWMRKSLTLEDRDMLVSEADGRISGYIIAQPVSALHLPAAHNSARVGTIDDFFASAFADSGQQKKDERDAVELLSSAEASLAARGRDAVLIVCPYDWTSKANLLADHGYRVGLTWFIRLVSG